MDDIYVYVVNLPDHIDEMVTPCEDGYTVYINKKLSEHRASLALRHAIGHVARCDWARDDIQNIEREAHHDEETSLSLPKILVRIPD